MCPRNLLWVVIASLAAPGALPAQDWFAAKGHGDGLVERLCFSPDGKRVITVSGRNQIGPSVVVWDLKTKAQLQTFLFPGLYPGWAAFSPQGNSFFYGATKIPSPEKAGWEVFDCDIDRGSARPVLSSSANETIEALLRKRALVVIKVGRRYRLLDLKSNKEVAAGPSQPLHSLAFSPDHSLWVLHEGERFRGQQPRGALVVLQLPSLKQVARFHVPEGREGWLITPDNKWLLTTSMPFEKTLYVWELPTGRKVMAVPYVRGLNGAVGDITANGRVVGLVSPSLGNVYFVDLQKKAYAGRQAFFGHFKCLKFSPDGRDYAVGDEGWLRLFHTREKVLKAATAR